MSGKPSAGRVRSARAVSPASPTRSIVGEEITRHLRELQGQSRPALDVDAIVGALVPAISALAGRGLLVSVSVTRDQRSLRLSTLIDKEWIEWFFDDHEDAGDLGAGIAASVAQ